MLQEAFPPFFSSQGFKGAIMQWRCKVCGYIHQGEEPPEICPVCGAPASEFEPFQEAPAASKTVPRWKCMVCGYIHEGDEPPEECPVCGAGADAFEPLESGQDGATEKEGGTFHVVIVGAGIAGVSAAEALRENAPDCRITLLSKEDELPYYRLNLTRYLNDEVADDRLPMQPASWYEERRIDLRLNTEVVRLDLTNKEVELCGEKRLAFDKLILTSGAHPFVPPSPGAYRDRVVPLRSHHDARFLIDSLRPSMPVICVGGGILGLEAAAGLNKRGGEVTVIEPYPFLMGRQLNERAGRLVEDHIRNLGIRLQLGKKTSEFLGDESVRGVQMEDDAVINADLAVICAGIRPNTYLARQAGMDVRQGILVNDYLETSVENVFSAGDVAEHQGVVYGIWPASLFQGRIAGMNAAGKKARFAGIPRSNTLKVLGLPLVSVGQVRADDGSYTELEWEAEGNYCRFLLRDNQMQGAIFVRETELSAAAKEAIEQRWDCSPGLGKDARAMLDFLQKQSATGKKD